MANTHANKRENGFRIEPVKVTLEFNPDGLPQELRDAGFKLDKYNGGLVHYIKHPGKTSETIYRVLEEYREQLAHLNILNVEVRGDFFNVSDLYVSKLLEAEELAEKRAIQQRIESEHEAVEKRHQLEQQGIFIGKTEYIRNALISRIETTLPSKTALRISSYQESRMVGSSEMDTRVVYVGKLKITLQRGDKEVIVDEIESTNQAYDSGSNFKDENEYTFEVKLSSLLTKIKHRIPILDED